MLRKRSSVCAAQFALRHSIESLTMCGIAGVTGRADAAGLARSMTRALAHRGPDGDGLFVGPEMALGQRRLAILDLSDRGRQPMTSASGRWTLVLNGEIFNYRELRAELAGVAWRSETDTEVLLEAIAAWGLERALERSIGMFALAAWDAQERTLTLARDRIGEKPLVYFHDGRTLAFASELKALGALHQGRLDAAAVDLYLSLGYVPAPASIFRHTYKLPAGHWLRWSARAAGSIELRRWWFPERAARTAAAAGRGERIKQLRALVADAVRLRLRADVPVALALSGGVDSTVIAAELSRQGASPDAFTVIFDGDRTDLPYAAAAAARYGLRHEVLAAEGASLDDRIQATLAQYDEPFADSSAVASLALARALAGRYKVILNGDGGDEAFAGYRHYEYIAAKQALKAAAAATGLVDGAGGTVYVASKSLFRERDRVRLLNGHGGGRPALAELLRSDGFLQAGPRGGVGGALGRALWSDRHLYLANDLTYKMDMALGAYGIEGRAPLLDHRILEWAQALEPEDLVRGRDKKVLFKAAYAVELPAGIAARAKHGFGAPVGRWLAGPLREQVADLLPCPLLEAAPQRGVEGQRLWTLYSFARWARHWRAAW